MHGESWDLDQNDLLKVLASNLRLTLSYGVFQRKQYVLSRLNTAGKLLYCSCRISGTDLMLTGTDYKEVTIDIADPTSIDKFAAAVTDDTFMLVAGASTEYSIAINECGGFDLDKLMG